jgi:hypothetical protein
MTFARATRVVDAHCHITHPAGIGRVTDARLVRFFADARRRSPESLSRGTPAITATKAQAMRNRASTFCEADGDCNENTLQKIRNCWTSRATSSPPISM